MKFEKQVSLKWAIALVLIACLVSSSIVYYVFAVSPSSAFTISSGVYPGAPSYTVWEEGGYYFAKDANGEIDYSGTDASTVIQAALDGLTSGRTWKEKVVLKGDFSLSTTLTIRSYTLLEVYGKLYRSPAGAGVVGVPYPSTYTDIEIVGGEYDSGFTTEAQWGDLGWTVLYFQGASNVILRDIKKVTGCQHGVWFGGAASNCKLENIYFTNLGTPLIIGSDYSIGEVNYCQFVNNQDEGMGIAGKKITIRNPIVSGNGITTPGAGAIFIYNGAEDVDIFEPKCYSNLNTAGIQIHDSTHVRVMGGVSKDNLRGIYESGTSDYNLITGVDVRNNSINQITKVGAHTKIRDCMGFVTENSGTATISASTTVTFNHGLAGTPTHVECGFKTTGYGSWIWSATTTNITITVATSGTYTFSWYAEYVP